MQTFGMHKCTLNSAPVGRHPGCRVEQSEAAGVGMDLAPCDAVHGLDSRLFWQGTTNRDLGETIFGTVIVKALVFQRDGIQKNSGAEIDLRKFEMVSYPGSPHL
jgi:hypothetical protein